MTLGAAYYVETGGGERDPYNWVPESSRRARGFAGPGRAPVARPVRAWSTSSSATARSLAGWPNGWRPGPRVTILNEVVLNQVARPVRGDRR